MPLFQLLKPTVVPRSQVAHLNPILYDDGRAVNEFFAPGTEYFGRQVVPPDNKWSDGTPSFMGMIPPFFASIVATTLCEQSKGFRVWDVLHSLKCEGAASG